mmetsp:Transcript_113001/g.326526  ORF Transcript_113001/g.326526 Transcript_113001/m.326526 type:complete len:422 (-) Transcript_113001:20-1285(-)
MVHDGRLVLPRGVAGAIGERQAPALKAPARLGVREHLRVDLPHFLPQLGDPGGRHVDHALLFRLVDDVQVLHVHAETLIHLRLGWLSQFDEALEDLCSLVVVRKAVLLHRGQVLNGRLLPEALVRRYDGGHAAAPLVLVERRFELDERRVHVLAHLVQSEDQIAQVLHQEVPPLPPAPCGDVVDASIGEVREPVLQHLDALEQARGVLLDVADLVPHPVRDRVGRSSGGVVLDEPPQRPRVVALLVPCDELLQRQLRLVQRQGAVQQLLHARRAVALLIQHDELAQCPVNHTTHEQQLVDFEEALAHEVEQLEYHARLLFPRRPRPEDEHQQHLEDIDQAICIRVEVAEDQQRFPATTPKVPTEVVLRQPEHAGLDPQGVDSGKNLLVRPTPDVGQVPIRRQCIPHRPRQGPRERQRGSCI